MSIIFQHVPVLGDLYLEHEFYSYDEPILFTCIDRRGTRYLCSCCYLGSQWVLGEITSGLLAAMIENSVTLRETFQKSNTCYFLQRTEVGYTITEDIPHDSFPREGEYLDLEDEKNSAFYTELCAGHRNQPIEVHSNYPSEETCDFSDDLNRSIIAESEFNVEEGAFSTPNIPDVQEYSLSLNSSQSSTGVSKVMLSTTFPDNPVYKWKTKSSAILIAA